MGQVDSTAVDTVIYGVSNVLQNNGWNIAFSGILVVFGGLVLIAVTIFLFNKMSEFAANKKSGAESQQKKKTITKTIVQESEKINEDHLAAIGVAVELYRRLHLETLESTVTFERGEMNSNWKAGARFGQRKSLR